MIDFLPLSSSHFQREPSGLVVNQSCFFIDLVSNKINYTVHESILYLSQNLNEFLGVFCLLLYL